MTLHAEPPAPPTVEPRRVRPLRWLVSALVTVAVLLGLGLAVATHYYDSVDPIFPRENPATGSAGRLPGDVRYAFVAAADPDFFEHSAGPLSGIDPADLTRRYVRIATADDDLGLREIILAAKLEEKYSRDEILGFYLDVVPVGRGAAGVQAAAQAFFRKDAGKLTVAEAAVLGAMIRQPYAEDGGPGPYDPKAHPDQAKDGWTYVLQTMADRGRLDRSAMGAMAYPSTVY